jgi:hypothetical protein
VGDRSRGCFTTPADFPLQDCSPYRGLHAAKFWDFPSFKDRFLSPRANPTCYDWFFFRRLFIYVLLHGLAGLCAHWVRTWVVCSSSP